ncbi:aspartate ammonia-lyase [Candidatus Micrarchaeota archaeon]|nr:aspartate ammonia-lyase [Candidatus Micrarchaeota archaeon]
MAYRTETDFLGAVRVPKEAYYGAFTVRAGGTFKLTGKRAPPHLLKSLLLLKKAAAMANGELGLVEEKKAVAITKAADEALHGKFDNEFIIDAFQAGAGTPYNMNANEILANRATELLGGRKGQYIVNPNNDVNASQSSNDTIPSATRLACLFAEKSLKKELSALAVAFRSKAKRFGKIAKTGRTHLQDAVPITLGQELASYASALERSEKRLDATAEVVKEIPLGGTALGTGINTSPEFAELAAERLSQLSGFELKTATDKAELEQNHNDLLYAGQSLTLLSIDLIRIANNFKLLSSGPKTGIGEIILPEVEPGSSIMPGKVNPSVPESVEMAGMHVVGAMHSIELSCMNAQLDLNTNTPLIAYNLLENFALLENACRMFREKCVEGIRADEKRCTSLLEQSTAVATALNPLLGYSKVSKLVQESVRQNKPFAEILKEKKILTPAQARQLLSPENLTKPNLKSGRKKTK